jgi:chromosome segregation ATPase
MSQPTEQKNAFQEKEEEIGKLANSYQEENKKLEEIDAKVRAAEHKVLDLLRTMRISSLERKEKLEKEYNTYEDEISALEREYHQQLAVCYPLLKALNLGNVQLANSLRNVLQNRINELEKQLSTPESASVPAKAEPVEEPVPPPVPARVNRSRASNLP